MSFARPIEEARSIIKDIQHDKTDGKDGGATSPVETPGGSTPIIGGPSHPMSEMAQKRTTLRTRTNSLKRQWS